MYKLYTHAHCISQLVDMYGPEAGKHLFRCLLSSVDVMSDGRSYGKDGQQLQMLCQEANALVSKPNFVSILCHGFEKQENKVRRRLQVVCFVVCGESSLLHVHCISRVCIVHVFSRGRCIRVCVYLSVCVLLQSLQPSSQLLTQVAKVLKLGNVQEVSC